MGTKNILAVKFLAATFSVTAAMLGAGYSFAQQVPASRAALVTTITSSDLHAMLIAKDFFLINVHVPYEGEIEKTDAFVAFDQIAANLDKLPKDRNSRIVLYCRSGRMSALAAQELVARGYTQIFDLAGGMNDWARSGFTIVRN